MLVNAARTVLLYGVAGVVGILLGLATAQVPSSCTGQCGGAPPQFPIWQSALIGLACAVIVVIGCALLDEEFLPVTRQWLRTARRRLSGEARERHAS
jgi:ABC-type antimicrobial peptide transport system permease subunit